MLNDARRQSGACSRVSRGWPVAHGCVSSRSAAPAQGFDIHLDVRGLVHQPVDVGGSHGGVGEGPALVDEGPVGGDRDGASRVSATRPRVSRQAPTVSDRKSRDQRWFGCDDTGIGMRLPRGRFRPRRRRTDCPSSGWMRESFFSVFTVPTRSNMTPMHRWPSRRRFCAILSTRCGSAQLEKAHLKQGLSRYLSAYGSHVARSGTSATMPSTAIWIRINGMTPR